MKIALASDLHLEFETITLPNTEGADVLILSGDIMLAYALHENPHPVEPKNPNAIWKPGKGQILAMRFREFLDHVSAEFPQVVYVAGNHEFYHGRFPGALQWLDDEIARYENIHFLEMTSVDIGDFTFLGGTLWTDCNKADPTTMQLLPGMMNDFRLVRNDQHNYRPFLPGDMIAQHRATLNYIKSVIDVEPDKKYIVVGHQAPTPLSIHADYKNDFYMNGGYASDLSEFILDRPQIKLWTHGHTHNPFDYMMGDTRVVCNPRGYKGHDVAADYFELKFLEV